MVDLLTMDDVVDIRVYDKTLGFQNVISDVDYYSFFPRLNAQGHAEISIPADASINRLLRTKGTRLSCRFRGEHLMSGLLRSRQGKFLTRGGPTVYQLQDDWRLLVNTPALVRPDAPLEATSLDLPGQAWQTGAAVSGTTAGQYGYYLWPAGVDTAEAAIKHLIQVNLVDWLHRPITIAPNQDRGGDARTAGMLPDIRFQPVAEAVQELLTWSGLVLTVGQHWDAPTIVVDVHEPYEWTQVITPESTIISDGGWSQNPPDATGVIVMGAGEDAARAFIQIRDTELEDEYGDIIIVTKDATGGKIPWPDDLADDRKVPKYFPLRADVPAADKAEFLRYLTAAGAGALADGAETSSLSLDIGESETFRFMGEHGVQLGDYITASSENDDDDQAPGITITDRIEEATVSLSSEGLPSATPVLGKRSDDPDRNLWDAIDGVDSALRNSLRKR
ncbi:hypothetical protein [Agreia sp. COWG]|uniref:Gp37-like protein n=1 Tax=Agreia sp. COWG TaxID=2773266 RepID=UPI001928CE13|nr:hypothetical protein [Agreia sp. COWG]CAD5999193.1 conserved protein of unknown function [Agreia sp. COWG]